LRDHTTIENLNQNIVIIKYKPSRPGVYNTAVSIMGHGTIIESLTVFVRPMPSLMLLSGSSKDQGHIGVKQIWKLHVGNVSLHQVAVQVRTPSTNNDLDTPSIVCNNRDGIIEIAYTPRMVGIHLVEIKIEGLCPSYLQLSVT